MDNKTEKAENNKTTDEKIAIVFRNMLMGAEEALAVIEDPKVQEAIATIASRYLIAYDRIKETTEKNIWRRSL